MADRPRNGSRVRTLLTFLSIVLTLSACRRPHFSMHVLAGTEPGSPLFTVDPAPHDSRPTAIDLFEVYQCGAPHRTVWKVAADSGLLAPREAQHPFTPDSTVPRHISRIVYGVTPPRYHTAGAAEPLEAGRCYVAEAESYGSGAIAFALTPEHEVVELPQDSVAQAVAWH
jgi:hypothetical protein